MELKIKVNFNWNFFLELEQSFIKMKSKLTPSNKTFRNLLKQPSRGVLRKRYSESMQQIYRRAHTCRSAISVKLQSNFIEITRRYGCSPVNLLHISRIPFFKNTSGSLLLNLPLISNSLESSAWLNKYTEYS